MKRRKPKKVAIALEVQWGHKRHLETYAGCQRYADEAGWDCSITPTTPNLLRMENGKPSFDGILARATPALASTAKRMKVPLVNLWLNSPTQNLPGVFGDFVSSGTMAAEHLIGRGFKRFGYLGFLRDKDAGLQLTGFRNRLKGEGLRCIAHRFSRESVTDKARGWKTFIDDLGKWADSWEPPIGIFVVNDLFCRYLIDVCRAKDLHVPQDVGIVGSSNEPTICASPPPTLTSIDLSCEQIGYRAASLLDRMMKGAKPPKTPELVPPLELIPRQSTDSYAADDPIVSRALRFIAESAHRPIKVIDVANETGVNRRTLERRFSESVGRSIAGEITRLRLARAKRQLVESGSLLKTVARACGFRNADHFHKVFARAEGITPTQYRKKRQ
ncbi:MAG: DNA-binding transcriptional regulator [Verrucomicrobiota bacterium]|nr:DNA-binding transcriptional regulator [Verrucomicrobiota bacterium]